MSVLIKRRAPLNVIVYKSADGKENSAGAISQMRHLFRAAGIANKRNFNYLDRARAAARIRARNSV